ncbi:MAG: c-type cytochrome [Pseudomonadota bacterium]
MNKLFTTIFAVAVAFATASGQAQEIKGDAKAGETKNAMCIGCHGIKGYQSSFPEIYKVPMISGQSAAYISSALHAYKKGDRKYPSMRGIAESLTDQDIADLAAYYSASGVVAGATLPADPKAPSPAVQALLNKANCASCHGANFSKPIDPSYPKIAGQHADYLFVALKSYKMDPGNAKVGRGNAIMAGMAKQYTNAELKAMAGYLSSVDGELKTVPESRFR